MNLIKVTFKFRFFVKVKVKVKSFDAEVKTFDK